MFNLFDQEKIILPWDFIKIPPLKEYSNGDIKLKINNPPLIRGYFVGLQYPNNDNWVLTKDGKLWMSLTPMELESHLPHVDAATGHTVIVGAGLGLILYNVLQKPEVTNVTLIENDFRIIELLHEMEFLKWPGHEKLHIIRADVFDVTKADLVLPEVDFLYVDIWETLGTEKALSDTQLIQSKFQAKKIGFWGQELEFIHWCSDMCYEPGPTASQYWMWKKATELPIIGEGEEYAELCYKAAINVSMY